MVTLPNFDNQYPWSFGVHSPPKQKCLNPEEFRYYLAVVLEHTISKQSVLNPSSINTIDQPNYPHTRECGCLD
jgi:hypothetical protein